MRSSSKENLDAFKNQVGVKYEMYNSLFTSLPFQKMERTGVLLSLFLLQNEEGYQKEISPQQIIERFFEQFPSYNTEEKQHNLLFRFIQYAERQVVLFDALEDAAFPQLYDMQGKGSMHQLKSKLDNSHIQDELGRKLKEFSVRLVLTAHPTQFYPREVLWIITDLADALLKDDTALVNSYLQQLGKTPFFKKEKPSPYDEAINLIWYLENVFYNAAGNILSFLKKEYPEQMNGQNTLIRMGFWPGGDRDGNPFVNTDITLKVAAQLRASILKCYYREVQELNRRLTFKGVQEELAQLEDRLYKNIFISAESGEISVEMLVNTLKKVQKLLNEEHSGLFAGLVEDLLNKVELFGLFFASLDIRQDSSVHEQLIDEIVQKTDHLPDNYNTFSEEGKIEALLKIDGEIKPEEFDNELFRDTLQVIRAIKSIQRRNGENSCHRYIISHATSALDVIEVFGLFLLGGWKAEDLSVDIVPLFESVEDLHNAGKIMRILYENEIYRKHLAKRRDLQTIMLGFSDGTKDGGYLMANWGIYAAKKELSKVSKEYGIDVVFFDGRGGPPARGGGKTHQFYASMGPDISNREIQLTVQGQTISSNFGNINAAQFNIEQLMNAGISNDLFASEKNRLSGPQEDLLFSLSEISRKYYKGLKEDPRFLDYLIYVTPLKYYGEANIGSRPSRRKPGKLDLQGLRAVPYVGSWSQVKQNVPGYYGVGKALEEMDQKGQWEKIEELYNQSLFFRTLLDNCEMAMTKSFFPLTSHLAGHPGFGNIWKLIYEEFIRTREYILKLTGSDDLMSDRPAGKISIQMRQRIELPLITIQQYALSGIRKLEEKEAAESEKETYKKLVIRCSFGIINAERNSA